MKKGTSVFISRILRHEPEIIDIKMDKNGWVSIKEFIEKSKVVGKDFSYDSIMKIVENNDKKRFEVSSDGKNIRAVQGHSISKDIVNVELSLQTPPAILYHGTATHFLESIKEKGLIPGSRQYVHLSMTEEVALSVGKRHGEPVILEVDTVKMINENHKFYISKNNVWLTDSVPPKFIKEKSEIKNTFKRNKMR